MLEAIDLDAVDSRGYAFQVEMTYRAIQAGFRVVEVPIVFRDRREGDSKMSRAIVAEAIWRVPAMRLRRRRQPRDYAGSADCRLGPRFTLYSIEQTATYDY